MIKQDTSSEKLQRELETLREKLAMLEQAEAIQREAELALRESEERYRRLVEHTPVAIVVHRQGEIIYANMSAARLVGASDPHELLGQKVMRFVHPDYHQIVIERIRQTQELGQSAERIEEKFIRLDGQVIDVEVVAIPITYYNEPASQVVVLDVTERKRAEDAEREQRQINEALRDTAALLNSTLHLNDLITTILDHVGRVVLHDAANIMLVEDRIVHVVGRRGYLERGIDEAVLTVRYVIDRTPNLRHMAEARAGMVISDTTDFSGWIITPSTDWIRSYVGAPLISQGEVIGFMNLDSATPGFFSEKHLERLQAFANQAAIALRNARLYKAEQQRRRVAETLRQATTVFNLTLELDEVLDALLRQVRGVIECDTVSIQRLDEDRLTIIACHGFERSVVGLQFPLEPGFPNTWVIGERTPMAVEDVTRDYPHFRQEADKYGSAHIQSWLGVPMLIRDQVSGMITLDRRGVRPFTPEDLELATAFASQAAIAIENAELHRSMRERATRLELIAQASHTTTNILELDNLLDRAVGLIGDMLGCYVSSILLAEGEHLVLRAISRTDALPQVNRFRIKIGEEGVTGWVARTGIPYLVADVSKEPRYVPVEGASDTRSELAVPIIFREQVVGVLNVESTEPDDFSQADVATLQTIADQLAIAVHGAQLYRQVQNHAMELEVRVAERTSQLEAAMTRLEELDHLKSKFIADVSHELRTPVTNLSVYVDLLKHGKPGKQAEYVTILEEQLGRLKALVEDILDLSRIELGADRVTFGPVDLNMMIRQTVLAHQPNAEAKGLQLTVELADDLPPIWGERNQLAQIASNLIANAINYTPEGQVCVHTVRDGSQGVYLIVRDTGMGLDQDDLPHLFERFYRGKHVGQSNIPGTGLGLAIVREIVNLHKGRIEVESKPGEGAAFKVWLPVG